MLQQEQSRRLSRVEVACHEAGHFAVGAIFGIPQGGLHLSGTGDTCDGRVSLPLISATSGYLPAAARKQAAIQLAAWYLAGRVAESIRRGGRPPTEYRHDSTRDAWNAQQVLEMAFADHRGHWVHCQRLAYAILTERWRTVARIAAELHDKGELTGKPLVDLHAAALAEPSRKAA